MCVCVCVCNIHDLFFSTQINNTAKWSHLTLLIVHICIEHYSLFPFEPVTYEQNEMINIFDLMMTFFI